MDYFWEIKLVLVDLTSNAWRFTDTLKCWSMKYLVKHMASWAGAALLCSIIPV
jgi:hypothetical protein